MQILRSPTQIFHAELKMGEKRGFDVHRLGQDSVYI